MINAKEELLDELDGEKPLCGQVIVGDVTTNLRVGYSDVDWEKFLEKIDVEYDPCFGCQELFGTIWLENGTWMERFEYDGSEWWRFMKQPEVPIELRCFQSYQRPDPRGEDKC